MADDTTNADVLAIDDQVARTSGADGYGLVDSGFIPKPFSRLLAEKLALARSLFGADLDLGSGSALRKILEVSALEDARTWTALGGLYDNQFVARVGWVPIVEDKGTLLHVALAGRYGLVNDRTLRLRSRPELNVAPYFVDTEAFAARDTRLAQAEVYYRPGPLLFGTEYFVQRVNAEEGPDPLFHGGDAVVTWLMTGETRRYNTAGGYFLAVSPRRTVLQGGPGAWEAVLRLSYIDLDDGAVHGGKFWRLTPMVNWYLTDHLRLELAYGIGQLDRFGLVGTTQFFQSRLQFQF